MNELIKHLISYGLFGFIGYCFWCVSKLIVASMICKHPELSDEKVKYLTRMMYKNNY